MGFLTKIYEMALPNCVAYSPYFYTFCILTFLFTENYAYKSFYRQL